LIDIKLAQIAFLTSASRLVIYSKHCLETCE